MITACKDCGRRKVGCYSGCAEYLAFRREMDEKSRREQEAKKMNSVFAEMAKSRKRK